VNGFALLSEAYEATEPGYDGHISVPVLWDRQTRAIVSKTSRHHIDLGTFGMADPATTCTPSGSGRDRRHQRDRVRQR